MVQEHLSGISALYPDSQSFLSEEHLKQFSNAYWISENHLKTWNTSGKEFPSERDAAACIARITFIYSSLQSCIWLLPITATLSKTSAPCERSFSKLWSLKTFLRNFLISERLRSIDLLAIKRVRAGKRFTWFRRWTWQSAWKLKD